MKRSAASALVWIAMLAILCCPLILHAQDDPIPISNVVELQAINDSPDSLLGHYILLNDIDAGVTAGWNGGAGFEPLGSPANPFRGQFDGNGHVISGLAINRPGTDHVGLFGVVMAATIENVGVTECSISGQGHVGALLGYGRNSEKIDNCHSSGTVTATGGAVGGLVGSNSDSVKRSHSSANVTAGSGDRVGGLVGDAVFVSYCYSTGAVVGHDYVGGLSGSAMALNNSYSTGPVTGNKKVGGLVGYDIPGYITNCYSTGAVTGDAEVGGLVGDPDATATSSYWDTETSGQATSPAGEGKSTAEMKQKATFVDWDFGMIWDINEGVSYPYFRPLAGLTLEQPVPTLNAWGLLAFLVLLSMFSIGMARKRKRT